MFILYYIYTYIYIYIYKHIYILVWLEHQWKKEVFQKDKN